MRRGCCRSSAPRSHASPVMPGLRRAALIGREAGRFVPALIAGLLGFQSESTVLSRTLLIGRRPGAGFRLLRAPTARFRRSRRCYGRSRRVAVAIAFGVVGDDLFVNANVPSLRMPISALSSNRRVEEARFAFIVGDAEAPPARSSIANHVSVAGRARAAMLVPVLDNVTRIHRQNPTGSGCDLPPSIFGGGRRAHFDRGGSFHSSRFDKATSLNTTLAPCSNDEEFALRRRTQV